LCILDFDDVELLFILLGSFSEPVSKLRCLLLIELLLVVTIDLLSLTDLIDLLLKSFILDAGQSDLVF